ncbi:MAG: ATP-dependent nuclease, partial [Anaerolineae bacterium]
MQIKQVSIRNYRNLDGTSIELNENVSFLVGENELGKSNFLDLLDTLFGGGRFTEDDFTDSTNPIEIEFSLKLSEVEQGAFEDIFDPEHSDMINVIVKQTPDDDRPIFYRKENHEDSPLEFPSSSFRCVNFIKYSSLRTPQEELSFYRGRGSGRFLSYLVKEYIKRDGSEKNYIVEETLK